MGSATTNLRETCRYSRDDTTAGYCHEKSLAGDQRRVAQGKARPRAAGLSLCLTRSLVALSGSERRLGGRESGDRHAERRAADVVHSHLVAEHNALRVAAVLPTDADLQVLAELRL